MPIALRLNLGHRTGPAAICDVCGSVVVDARLANVCWLPNGEEQIGGLFQFKIACKEDCTRELDRLEGHQFTQELELFIGCLTHNAHVDTRRMKQTMELMSLLD